MTLWGTGTPRREFLHVDDLASAACFVMENYQGGDLLNVGMGDDLSIAELAKSVARVVDYRGEIHFDPHGPTARPASCWTCRDCMPWVGGRALDLKTASALRTSGIVPMRRLLQLDDCSRRNAARSLL